MTRSSDAVLEIGIRRSTIAADLPVRSGLNNLLIFSKLREARSRLYRRQIFEVNIRWKALDEIYKMFVCLFVCLFDIPRAGPWKMYILLHRSDLKISAKKSS